MNKSKRQLNLYFQISEIYTISRNLTEQDLREVSENVLEIIVVAVVLDLMISPTRHSQTLQQTGNNV